MKSSGEKNKLAFHILLISTFQLTVRNSAAAVNTLEALQFCSMRQDAMDHYSIQQMFNPEQCANHLHYATNSLKTLNFSKSLKTYQGPLKALAMKCTGYMMWNQRTARRTSR